jgi:hypothetical protein
MGTLPRMIKHFAVERHNHPVLKWRVVNRHIGHGLLFPTQALARASASLMNKQFRAWERAGKENNPFPRRK